MGMDIDDAYSDEVEHDIEDIKGEDSLPDSAEVELPEFMERGELERYLDEQGYGELAYIDIESEEIT